MSPSSLKDLAFSDLDREIAVTRRVLERLPENHFSWKPHEKSMPLGRLAMHVANLLQWMLDTLNRDGFDMASPPAMRNEPTDLNDVLKTFDQNAAAVKAALAAATDASLAQSWSLRSGPQILHSAPRVTILRIWCLNHLIHHRAQLCTYLRLHNIPVPTVYFNSADEPDWTFT
ncbi:MAG TPA: DinB family protein [Tepidisphaeraceae bacterium]|jgi:uncharacterized damage-inducible protein DinB|nr:DinB family protein [Tepidisphaeraceae bacterium]